jgi:hypothetical protein
MGKDGMIFLGGHLINMYYICTFSLAVIPNSASLPKSPCMMINVKQFDEQNILNKELYRNCCIAINYPNTVLNL